MADETVPEKRSEGSIYDRVREDIKKRKPLLAATLAGDPEILERVRQYESQAASLLPSSAGFVAARGEDIEKLALLDAVTELYNHRAFVKELKSELARAKRYGHHSSLIMLSVDNFDEIGEKYGGMTRDAVLKVVSNVIRLSIREVDLGARYAPLQFSLILAQTNTAGASLVAERIRARIASQVFSHNWQNFSITASIGVATYPEHAIGYDELIARSIEALECSAERGGDRVFSF